MKSVLISIQPKWCELIANGKKTVEVRKTRPKIDTPFKCYIYCTKNKRQYLRKLGTSYQEIFITENRDILGKTEKVKSLIGDVTTFWENGGYNGKVVGEFVCDAIITDKTFGHDALFKASACMSDADISAYCLNKEMYCWHIYDLVIYDKPKELSEFYRWTDYDDSKKDKRPCSYCEHNAFDYSENCEYCSIDYDGEHCVHLQMKRPPQSWCYVDHPTEKGGADE